MSSVLGMAIRFLSSLKLTVTLLGMSIFIVFAGTLAQKHAGIWDVMERYFRCPIAWVELKIFHPALSGSFPFPGGWLIGGALIVNLVVSHLSRIQIPARGGRLALGGLVFAAGAGLTGYFITHVFDQDSSQQVIDPTWRVSRQLLEGLGASLVLLVGCRMIFGRKAGIVLLHLGVVLLMASELVTGLLADEGMMTIYEGQTVNYVEDTREIELAVIDPSDPAVDRVTAIPGHQVRAGGTIRHPDLPFDVTVKSYMANSDLQREPGENPATAGDGLVYRAVEHPPVSGTDSDAGVDLPSAYVALADKSGAPLGTWLVSTMLSIQDHPQTVSCGGRSYDVYLRFRRTTVPYAVHLKDFVRSDYVGTDKPSDFSAFVRLQDAERGVDRDVRIWMNNPLRYRGDTIYQSGWTPDAEGTRLQVVDNAGWMVPYIGCMIVATGMLAQFGMGLWGFLRKRAAA